MANSEDLLPPQPAKSEHAVPPLSVEHFLALTLGCALAMFNSGFTNLLAMNEQSLVADVMVFGALLFDITWALALGGLFILVLLSFRGWHPSNQEAHYAVASLGIIALAILGVGWTRQVDSSEMKLSQMVLLVALAIQTIIYFLAIRSCKLSLLSASFGFAMLTNVLLILTISQSSFVLKFATVGISITLIAQCLMSPACVIEAMLSSRKRDWLEWYGYCVYLLVYAIIPLYWLGAMFAARS